MGYLLPGPRKQKASMALPGRQPGEQVILVTPVTGNPSDSVTGAVTRLLQLPILVGGGRGPPGPVADEGHRVSVVGGEDLPTAPRHYREIVSPVGGEDCLASQLGIGEGGR
jgi:hypothetical protein